MTCNVPNPEHRHAAHAKPPVRRARLVAAFGAVFLIAAAAGWAEPPSADQIMARVMETQRADTAAMDIEMTLIDVRGAERMRRLQTLSMTVDELTSTVTVFLSPPSVRNTRFLTVERAGGEDQWIFLPAVGRSRRIASAERGGSFMGSDFSYADMASTTYDTDEAVHRLLRTEERDGRETFVVESIPRDDAQYSRTVVWVDTSTYLPVRVLFWESGNDPAKELVVTETERVEGRWVATDVTMTTLETGHRTRVRTLQARFDIPLNEGYFTVSFLETGRL